MNELEDVFEDGSYCLILQNKICKLIKAINMTKTTLHFWEFL